ncbi:phage protein Gp36 family protein [uncultured Campylobacter sp.]|uniref:phage protein Gp36 family protein n=1 Tax=uncultured Campylobacter sp. TaxID=218934 RepID=UPI00262060F8|nr:phage protein Gp36 family protein [uncultured Campylobacter sp.]
MITNDDLLEEVSHKELLELSDFEGSGSINQSIIDDSLNDALAFIASFIRIPANPTKLLKDICVDLTIIELKKRNNFPKDILAEQIEKIEGLLLKMAAGKIPTDEKKDDTPRLASRAFRHYEKRMDLKDLNG